MMYRFLVNIAELSTAAVIKWQECQCTELAAQKTDTIIVIHLPRYAGVPTMERRNDFSPMILAKPKSHNLT